MGLETCLSVLFCEETGNLVVVVVVVVVVVAGNIADVDDGNIAGAGDGNISGVGDGNIAGVGDGTIAGDVATFVHGNELLSTPWTTRFASTGEEILGDICVEVRDDTEASPDP